ncbi:hypothetical protein K2173_010815 [Erythroxylum novogranatense]|uniref:non-specific serine/threonine protein kinase n=1 Tax=Erythroxylum novogranatense TaxID=1862640 RepID=A0AAV8T1H6_9ROSI|nr:hypothetical protein K2173_010815 [Erythroxylum novogranatense]
MKFFSVRLLVWLQLQVIFFFLINLQWLKTHAAENDTDRLALIKFREGIISDPRGVFNSWNESLPFCSWFGVSCSQKQQRVTSLILEGRSLLGTISPYIGNLSFLRNLSLQNNSLRGDIPQELGSVFALQEIRLNNNSIGGEIPVNLSRCSLLRRLDLFYNNISGRIPSELGSLPILELLRLGSNKLSGEIPPSLGNLSSLTYFTAPYNSLYGTIPDSFGRLKRLNFLSVGNNLLSGTIPPSLFNISSISTISLPKNQLRGSLPDNIGFTLPNLQHFSLGGNGFSGPIPASLSNSSQLQQVDLPFNEFVGQVPNLGNSQNLWWLNLGINRLGGDSAQDLTFLTSLINCSNLQILDISYNHFQGVLPGSLSNLSVQLSDLYLGGNQFSGNIPMELDNLINLTILGMEVNLFTGVFPSYFGKFQKLQGLALNGNKLSGLIPPSIGNLSQLIELYLQENNFEGSIPSSIGDCQNLQSLDISRNNLNGAIPSQVFSLSSLTQLLNLSGNLFSATLPAEVGKLTNINTMDISENNITGEIPSTIGDCSSLENLYLQGNAFQGPIPSSLSLLKGLQRVDFSRNNLTGEIPQDLVKITFLEYMNVSFNNLEGEVSTMGVFSNASAISLVGNKKLCGGVSELNLPKCPNKAKKKGLSLALKLTIIIVCSLMAVLLLLAILAISRVRRSKRKTPSETTITSTGHLLKVTYKELCQATDEFSSANLIGYGGFGSVYKGVLSQVEGPVAIKVLNLQVKGASKSFTSECKALASIRHRNLVKIITYCSSLDYKRNEFKALVFEFMPNGSLENWLHPELGNQNPPRILKLLERLNIAIDVASALYYLHDLCESPIIHCDLKPGNVLLDCNMVGHVSDFGMARILSTIHGVSKTQTSSIGLKGTIGYAPPEYGMGGEASKEGDVYSYGVLLLEMFSGKRPTDQMLKDGLNLHEYVNSGLPDKVLQIMDQTVLQKTKGTEMDQDHEESCERRIVPKNLKKCVSLLLGIGVRCSAESPRDRMKMVDVIRELHLIKEALFEP